MIQIEPKKSLPLLFSLFFTTLIVSQNTISDNDPSLQEEDTYELVDDDTDTSPQEELSNQNEDQPRYINDISIIGNTSTTAQAILNRVPYKIGQLYSPLYRRTAINNVYELKKFRSIALYAQPIGQDKINLIITVQEKTPIKEIICNGNKHINTKDIEKALKLSEITFLDPEEMNPIAQKIKKLYQEKGYLNPTITPELSLDEDQKGTVTFEITEGKKTTVKRITFKGNKHVTDKVLRDIMLTKEDWVLGFLDRSGSYIPERTEYGDKQVIEQYYQNNGFLAAKVTAINSTVDPKTQDMTLEFEIEEGDLYIIDEIHAQASDEFSEELLLANIPLRPGMLYCRDAIAAAIKRLEFLWGNLGYIFTHVEPSIIPNPDTKKVAVSFFFDKGNKVTLNRISIAGNKKTRDKIIRRKIVLQEDELITQAALNKSKQSIQSLGFFDARDGVIAKIKRINKDTADVDFVVKEMKTGHAGFQMGFGGTGVDFNSPASGFTVKGDVSDTNFLGTGTNLNLSASWAKDEQTIMFHVAQPWLFDKPFLGALDIYHKRPTYSELHNVESAINEKLTGGALTAGFIAQSSYEMFQETNILTSFGIDSITYQKKPIARYDRLEFQPILDQAFKQGEFIWVSNDIEQDTRNHPMHPSSGHRWKVSSKVAIPSFNQNISYYRVTLDANWFTSIIDEYNLVLRIHGFFGIAAPLKGHTIPFGELFHIGGDNSVRGFLFGQIGPRFLGDSIGAQKAFFINTELVFPITPDFTLKGVLFYDGGAGWNNPYTHHANAQVSGNSFDYRHSVGVGVRLLKPMPIKIDWGFKIDPRSDRRDRRNGESASEIHFGMSYDF